MMAQNQTDTRQGLASAFCPGPWAGADEPALGKIGWCLKTFAKEE